jgi:hypothetical protein
MHTRQVAPGTIMATEDYTPSKRNLNRDNLVQCIDL